MTATQRPLHARVRMYPARVRMCEATRTHGAFGERRELLSFEFVARIIVRFGFARVMPAFATCECGFECVWRPSRGLPVRVRMCAATQSPVTSARSNVCGDPVAGYQPLWTHVRVGAVTRTRWVRDAALGNADLNGTLAHAWCVTLLLMRTTAVLHKVISCRHVSA